MATSSPFVSIVFLLIIGALLFSNAGPQIAQAISGITVASGYTKHALDSHSEQKWNAVSIKNYMEDGKCKPTMYACPSNGYDVAYCEIYPGKAIGIIIIQATQKIITGYFGSKSYWENRCK